MNKKCQVFTPKGYVETMLNLADYKEKLFGKKVLENSCGEGHILSFIVERYINDCLSMKYDNKKIINGLENDIVGYEIDQNVAALCAEKLNLIAKKYGLSGIKWNIKIKDFLFDKDENKYDFIIGNPPYIKYSELDVNTRNDIRNSFHSCKVGKFDYCYPFVEKSLKKLNKNGIMVYLIPNSIFKNTFARELRKIIKPNITKILDYKSLKIFEDALTSSAIIVLSDEINSDFFEYNNMYTKSKTMISKNDLLDKWVFSKKNSISNQKIFSDYFNASISVATLLNKAFVLKSVDDVEKEVVRSAASPKNLIKAKKEYIIFPYKYVDDRIVRYENDEFEKKFPKALAHLKSYDEDMKKRKTDANCRYFEYGRAQAIKHLNQEKLVLSTVITKKVKVFKVAADVIPYSGIYITKNEDNKLYNIDFAKRILESDEFMKYVYEIGINATGDSMRLSVNDIKKFNITKFLE